jgi:hypothetical protein
MEPFDFTGLFPRENVRSIAIDTLENYAVNDEAMMRATAALIQCASNFSRAYAHQNLQLKVFVMAEIFPYLKEEVVLNTLKFVRDEVHLHWRPKELMTLITHGSLISEGTSEN